ncbi:MAG: hypothetical protein VX704_01750, partial [Verrucomicrobiota bacterium]|nr:hypothetical protein [Verrucomicrobiota bacterium]
TNPTCVLPSSAGSVSLYSVVWKEIVIVTAIQHCPDSPLFHIASAVGFYSGLLGTGQGWEE